MHYEVEVRMNTGDWLAKRERHKLLADAELEADQVRDRGGEPRIVRVDEDGSREVVGWGRAYSHAGPLLARRVEPDVLPDT